MAERIKQKFTWSSLSRLEQLTLLSSILIWSGVLLLAIGLYFAFRNYGLEQSALAEGTAIARSEEEDNLTPSPTSLVFPAGWVTATPTPSPTVTETPIFTPSPTARATPSPGPVQEVGKATATPRPTTPSAVHPRPSLTKTPRPTPIPTRPPPASGPPERLRIPAIGLDAKVVPVGRYSMEENGELYSVWQVADYAVGWHNTSAYPGHTGNIVLNGHHNIKGEVFRRLVDLKEGDLVMVYAEGHIYYYVVVEKHILKEKGEPPEVRRRNAQWIAPTDDERLTMVTCWPYTNNTHRLVVVAKPVIPESPLEDAR